MIRTGFCLSSAENGIGIDWIVLAKIVGVMRLELESIRW